MPDLSTQAIRALKRDWAAPIGAPLSVVAVMIVLLNDHLLEPSALIPEGVAGKLSDVAGLFFFPALLLALARGAAALSGRSALARKARDPRLLFGLLAATAVAFSAVNTWPAFNRWVGGWFGEKALDGTDLWAMVILMPSWFYLRRFSSSAPMQPSRRLRSLLALAGALLATAATSPARITYPRGYAAWEFFPAPLRRVAFRTLRIAAWVSKSGKEGFGVSICLENRGDAPLIVNALRASALLQDGRRVDTSAEVVDERLGARTTKRLYLPLIYDNNAAWNAGIRRAELHLRLRVAGMRRGWRWPLQQRRARYHRKVYDLGRRGTGATIMRPPCGGPERRR